MEKAPDGRNLISIEDYEPADQRSLLAITKHSAKPNHLPEQEVNTDHLHAHL